MDTNDILLVVGCLVIGYGLVSMLMRKPGPPPAAPAPPPSAGSPPPERAPAPSVPPHWSSVLQIPEDAGVEEIREAYKRRISQYHPDKVASLGRELQELAEAKTKDITIAYQDALMERRASP